MQAAEIKRLATESDKIPVLVRRLEEVQAKSSDLAEENEEQRTTINLLSRKLDSAQDQLQSVFEDLATASNERDALSTTRADLELAVANLQDQLGSQSANVNELNELLRQKTQEHSQAAETLQRQIESQSNALEVVRQEFTLKSNQHDDVLGNLANATEKMHQQQAVIEKLTVDLENAEHLRPANKTLQDRIAELTAHLNRLGGELNDSLDANAKGQDRIRNLENQLHDHVVKIRELRRNRGSISGLSDDPQDDAGRQAA